MTGPQQEKTQRYIDCLKQKAREGEVAKGSVLNPYRLRLLCGGDLRTAHDHLPELRGVEIDGTLKPLDQSSGSWMLIDPPEDEIWLSPKNNQGKKTISPSKSDNVSSFDHPVETDDYSLFEEAAFAACIFGIGTALQWIVNRILQQCMEHVCSWCPVPGREPWVQFCQLCGKLRNGNLLDPEAPFHFVPAQNFNDGGEGVVKPLSYFRGIPRAEIQPFTSILARYP